MARTRIEPYRGSYRLLVQGDDGVFRMRHLRSSYARAFVDRLVLAPLVETRRPWLVGREAESLGERRQRLRMAGGPVYVLRDLFIGPDGQALTAHYAEAGGPWTVRSGTPQIEANRLKDTAPGGDARYTQQSLRSDGSLRVTLRSSVIDGSTGFGILFREADDQSALLCQLEGGVNLKMYRRTAGGGYTQIGIAGFTPVADTDYRMRLELAGSSLEAYIDDVLKLTVSESTNQSATRHGFRNTTTAANRFDTWEMPGP